MNFDDFDFFSGGMGGSTQNSPRAGGGGDGSGGEGGGHGGKSGGGALSGSVSAIWDFIDLPRPLLTIANLLANKLYTEVFVAQLERHVVA